MDVQRILRAALLMGSSSNGNKEIAGPLLKAAAECSKKNIYGLSAMDIARNTIIHVPGGNYSAVINALTSSCQ